MNALTIQYTQNNVTVLIPADQANTWCVSDQIGIVESLIIGSFGFLDVLIEKDFACLDRNDEENDLRNRAIRRPSVKRGAPMVA